MKAEMRPAGCVALLESKDLREAITTIIGVTSAAILEQCSTLCAQLMHDAREHAKVARLLGAADFTIELMLATRYPELHELDASLLIETSMRPNLDYAPRCTETSHPTVTPGWVSLRNLSQNCPALRCLNLQIQDETCRRRIFSGCGNIIRSSKVEDLGQYIPGGCC